MKQLKWAAVVLPLLASAAGAAGATAAAPGAPSVPILNPTQAACNDVTGGDKAIAACTTLIELGTSGTRGDTPNFRRDVAYSNRGYVYRQKGDLDRAIADYDAAIRIKPDNYTTWNNRCLAYTVKSDFDRAIADCNESVRLNPRYALAWSNRGFAFARKGDLGRAIADLDQAIKLDAANPMAFSNRGLAFERRAEFDRAFVDLNEALRLNPNLVYALVGRGRILRRQGELDRAIADYNKVIELSPKMATAYNLRGRTFFYKEQYDKALADLSKAIEIDPNYAAAYSNRADLRARLGDLAAANADSEQALKLDPKAGLGHAARAFFLAKRGDLRQADEEMATALQLESDPYMTLIRGEVRAMRGDHPAAVADFDFVLQKDPFNPLAKRNRDASVRAIAAGPSSTRVTTASTPSLPLTSALQPSLPGQRRVALVIGNSGYQSVARLPNPSRDAQSMANLFRSAGFDSVQTETDVGIVALRRALREFADKAVDADIAVVFFAGHGIEIGGQNYLLPIDAALRSDLDVKDEAVDLDRVLELLPSVKRLKFVIVDACRDNPFKTHMRQTSASRSVGRGLARPSAETSDTLIAYAAKAGSTADDGDGDNSPFTAALLARLTQPNTDLRIALGRVHDDVLKATRRSQEPYLYGALGGDALYLGPAQP